LFLFLRPAIVPAASFYDVNRCFLSLADFV